MCYDAYDLLKREFYEGAPRRGFIGRIDLVFQYRSKLWVGEIKYQPYEGKDFWDALKVIGYCHYYNWQNEDYIGVQKTARPCIFMPASRIKLHWQIIANKIGIVIFGISEKDGNFFCKPLNLDVAGRNSRNIPRSRPQTP